MTQRQKCLSKKYPKAIGVVLMCTIPSTALGFYLPLAKELRHSGYNVSFCFGDGDEAKIISSEGFRVKVLSVRRNPFYIGNAIAVLQLTLFLRKNHVKVIQISTPVASVVGRLAAVLANVPVRINAVWGLFPRETHGWQSIIFDFAESLLHRTSSYTLTLNKKDEEELLRKGFAKQGKIKTIAGGGFGVDLKKFDPSRFDQFSLDEIRKTLNLDKTNFVVTLIGRLTADKGIIDYIEALARLSRNNDDIRGLVVGEELEDERGAISRAELEVLLAENKINDRVVLTGFRSDIPELMAISDVVVLPSKREGFGQVLAEAAVMGKPVVAYKNRGAEEAVIDGKTGFLVELGDIEGFIAAIQNLHDNQYITKEIGNNARIEGAKRFDPDEISRGYLAIYEQIIQEKLPGLFISRSQRNT